MTFHRGDPDFIKLFVTVYHENNIDLLTGKPLEAKWENFVDVMRQNMEYLPKAATQKNAKEFYKKTNPFNKKYWTPTKEQRLKGIKQWLVDQYKSRIPLKNKPIVNTNEEQSNISEDIQMNDLNSNNIPPAIAQIEVENNLNINNITEIGTSIDENIQVTSPQMLQKQVNILEDEDDNQMVPQKQITETHSSDQSDEEEIYQNQNRYITINRKKKKKKPQQNLYESSSESEELIKNLDLSFRSRPNLQQIKASRARRRDQESQIQHSRNTERLQTVRSNTRQIVTDLINAAIPTIVNNNQIQQIVAEEQAYRTKQDKINAALIKNLKRFSNSTEKYFSILEEKIDRLLQQNNQRTSKPQKRKRTYEDSEDDIDWP